MKAIEWTKENMAITKRQALYLCLLVIVVEAILIPLIYFADKLYYFDWAIRVIAQMLN